MNVFEALYALKDMKKPDLPKPVLLAIENLQMDLGCCDYWSAPLSGSDLRKFEAIQTMLASVHA